MIRSRLIHWIPAVLSAAVVFYSTLPVNAQQSGPGTEPEVESSVIPVAQVAAEKQSGVSLEVERVAEGSSSRLTRRDATEQLPLALLTPEGRTSADGVLQNLSLYRRMPTIRLQADQRVYNYFTKHPDVAVSFWRAMQISQVQMQQLEPDVYAINTGDGTVGKVTVLHQSDAHHLILCEGEFQSPALNRPMQAKALMHLQPKFQAGVDGRTEVTHTLDLFVAFPSQTVETLARLVSPVSNHVADRNFEEVSLFAEMMDVAMTRQPGWVEQMVTMLDQVPEEVPHEVLQITAAVYVDAQKRGVIQRTSAPVEVQAEQVTKPFLQRIFR